MSKGLGIAIIIILAVLLAIFYVGRVPSTSETEALVTAIPDGVPSASPSLEPVSGLTPPAEPVAAPTVTETPAVSISGNGFSLATVSVGVGGSVIFTNNDNAQHQVVSNPHPLHTIFPPLNGPVLEQGGAFTATFSQAGSFDYHDHLNPGLTGTVVVQ